MEFLMLTHLLNTQRMFPVINLTSTGLHKPTRGELRKFSGFTSNWVNRYSKN